MSAEMKAEKAADHGFSALRNALAARRKVYGTTIRDLHAVFDAIDKDGSGALDHDEFGQAMHRMGLGLSKAQVASIIQRIDSDGNGYLDVQEVKALVGAMTGLPAQIIPDSHPEVQRLANKSTEELTEQLWQLSAEAKIEGYYCALGLGSSLSSS